MALLIKPELNELAFRRKMLESKSTMRFAGEIKPFPKEDWQSFYDTYVATDSKEAFYGFVFCRTCNDFTGSCGYRLNMETGHHEVGVLIHAAYRESGYGREAVRLIREKAAENGIHQLYASVPKTWDADGFMIKAGFVQTGCDETKTEYMITC